MLLPRRRTLLRDGVPQPLIPRYFDLLLFLVERRGQAVHRRDIFDRVWTDVIVSDSALTQAVRTLRRVLDDDAREPRFVRTVSRHGYEFVCPDVVEEDDLGDLPTIGAPDVSAVGDHPIESQQTSPDPFDPLLRRLTDSTRDEEDRRDAAERLHPLGMSEVLRRLVGSPDEAMARALLRDTRWEAADSGAVPILGAPRAAAVVRHLILLRLRRAGRLVSTRWTSASVGGGIAGIIAGGAGGLLLVMAPDSSAPLTVAPVLAAIGGAAGSLGAAGVAAGLALAEAVTRSYRVAGMMAGGAIGGATIGGLVERLARWSLATIVGIEPPVGGTLEGLVIGAAAGIGYSVATRRVGNGFAAPRGTARIRVAATTALACAAAGLALALSGHPLVGGTVHSIAQASVGARALLTPLGRLIGEPDFGPVSAMVISVAETAAFGFGVAFGLTTRRP